MLVPAGKINRTITATMPALLEKLKQITPLEVMAGFERIDILPPDTSEIYKLHACFFRGTPAIDGHFQLIAMEVASKTDDEWAPGLAYSLIGTSQKRYFDLCAYTTKGWIMVQDVPDFSYMAQFNLFGIDPKWFMETT